MARVRRLPANGTVVVPAGTFPVDPTDGDFVVPDTATIIAIGIVRDPSWSGAGTKVATVSVQYSHDGGVEFVPLGSAGIAGGEVLDRQGAVVTESWIRFLLPVWMKKYTGPQQNQLISRRLRLSATLLVPLRTAVYLDVD